MQLLQLCLNKFLDQSSKWNCFPQYTSLSNPDSLCAGPSSDVMGKAQRCSVRALQIAQMLFPKAVALQVRTQQPPAVAVINGFFQRAALC